MEPRNLAEAPTQKQTQQELKDAIKVVGLIGRWLFFLGLGAGWVLWACHLGLVSRLHHVGQSDATIATGADRQDHHRAVGQRRSVGLGFPSAREALCRLGDPSPCSSS